jgi:erythromycin esterase-like protein
MKKQLLALSASLALLPGLTGAPSKQSAEAITPALRASLDNNQYDLDHAGRAFLLTVAKRNSFFLLGELHGDNEIPSLLAALWPDLSASGYRFVAGELSPWTANELQFASEEKRPALLSLWTRHEVDTIRAFANAKTSVLWGCDMEEEQPQYLVRELALLNPNNSDLARMMAVIKDGYSRSKAPDLLTLLEAATNIKDQTVNGISLRDNLLATLGIESDRLKPETKMNAQEKRERLMKDQFLRHFRREASREPASKVLLRFGRNHLHRGYDARGISTLGNFVAEFAISQGNSAFNVGAFGAGGTAALFGQQWDADERPDELAFAVLAEHAKYPATIFDLRPLRPLLHQIPEHDRTALDRNLIYWADAYDALICFKNVTPRQP